MNTILSIASTDTDYAEGKKLVMEYAGQLNFDLSFQQFDDELLNFNSMYSAPDGGLIIASVDDASAGVTCLRKSGTDSCELKRMYVKKEFRGAGIGKLLLEGAIELARQLGYGIIRLDTDSSMRAAIRLYIKYGFNPFCTYPLKNF